MSFLKSCFKFLGLVFLVFNLFSCSTEVNDNKYVIANISEPARTLLPADSYESSGYKIINLLFSGLFSYDESGNMINEVAKSVNTQDNKYYIVKIRSDIKFSDGSKLKAHNFVNAWNYAVKQKLSLSDFFSDIKGYPKAGENFEKLSGLKIIDDYTFSIDLKYPVYDFIYKLGYLAFYPMHDKAFKDIELYGNYPIGNGPYKFPNEKAWVHNKSITLIPNNYYKGHKKSKNQGIIFNVYQILNTAYADLLSGQLDVLESIPTEQLNNYHNDLNDRFIDKNSNTITYLSINVNSDHFKLDKEGILRRKALSMAINREEVSRIIFYNTKKPAKDFVTFVEYNDNLKGNKVLKFNPQEAKKFWKEANKISRFDDTFTISYNSEGDHQEWINAICNQLRNNLGIKVIANAYPDFKSFLSDVKSKKIKYAFRSAWSADYPSASTFLAKYLSYTLDFTNSVSYKNIKFDNLFKNAIGSVNFAKYKYYINLCQEVLLKDLPDIPLFYGMINGGFSKNVKNVKFGWDSMPLYYNIIKE